ncbi:MAG: hypothetical protein QOG30_2934 [Acidimicrobiaceae bacterium]|jgi:uncharacterized membrane protein
MRITKFAGLPAHPLFVHIPVVLLPLVAIGAIGMALSARIRDRLGWVVLVLSIIAGLSTQLAIGSGKALVDSVTKSSALDQHVAIAESIRPLALLLFVVALGVMLLDRRARSQWPFRQSDQKTAPPWMNVVLAAMTVTVALATCARLYQIGDSGAKATWQNTPVVRTDANRASSD